ncbi:MAG: zf-HC2 domain-containing protein [Magnetococcus sp. MYC-9]
MNNSATDHAIREKTSQQLAVLLTLAAGQSPQAEACPPPERLAALLEGSLQSGQRAPLLEHLDRCPDCYRAWLVGSALRPAKPASNLLFLRRSPYLSAVGALAMAASLMLVVVRWDPFAPDLPGMLSVAYQTASLQALPPNPPQPVPGKGEAMTLGFAGTNATTPARQAFIAGSTAGWAALGGQVGQPASSAERKWELYHYMGQWTTLLQTLCQAEPPPPIDLLRQQAGLGQGMAALLAKRAAAGEVEARIPQQEMETLYRLLNIPASAEPAHRLCRQIQKSCATIVDGLLL